MVALAITPREEEPQIVVPMADIFISMPGYSASEVEQFVSTRLEKMLYQIDGVEYVYSMSRPNSAVVTVRFFVGESREDSLVRLHNKIQMNLDKVPPGVTAWVVKPVEIDDVPILAITLYSDIYSSYELRRLAEELEIKLQAIPNTGPANIVGGQRRMLTVRLDPNKLAAHELTPLDIDRALKASNAVIPAGTFQRNDREVNIDAGGLLVRPEQVRDLMVGIHGGRPVYLKDVAEVYDGPEELNSYTFVGFGPAAAATVPETFRKSGNFYPSVTLAIAKQKGSNAVAVSKAVQERLDQLKKTVLPQGVYSIITRDYGKTANDKVNDLVVSLGMAILVVIGLLVVSMGWRESLIVGTAVPITFSLVLLVNYLAGYTINRVTLFAIILSLGLVVDDPIMNVDNIQRHILMRRKNPFQATLDAVQEVLPPVILSTLAIIASFAPMFFITGMMGPYMRPMAINVPLAVSFSTVCALTIVPWLCYKMLGSRQASSHEGEPPRDVTPRLIKRLYGAVMVPCLRSGFVRWSVVGLTTILFALAAALAALGYVPLKMLPFDNKNELQIVVDMDEGATLEETAAATSALASYMRNVAEVTDLSAYIGLSSPMDFNGMVRHYYLRQGSNVADIRVNLADKSRRQQQSHEIGLRVRDDLSRIAAEHGANIKLVEMPPGPPVLATITAEVYGGPYHSYEELADASRLARNLMEQERELEDIDDSLEAPKEKYLFRVDKEKAALNGVSTQDIARVVQIYLGGSEASILRAPYEANPLPIYLQLPRKARSSLDELRQLYVRGQEGQLVQISELGDFEKKRVDQTIYHKNLQRVVYLYGEMAGRPPAEAIFSMQSKLAETPLPEGFHVQWAGEGEWKITVDVFRDLGIAFGIACFGIFILLVYETRSYLLPLVLMIAIPLTIIGIMPGFFLLNALTGGKIGGFPNPVFFTATAMIGMIALAGIVVRNSVVLITFIRDAMEQGAALQEAILSSGAVRMRPIFLTATTTALSALPITLDPIFSGLAWALIFGLFVSTAFSLVLVPMIYYMIYRRKVV